MRFISIKIFFHSREIISHTYYKKKNKKYSHGSKEKEGKEEGNEEAKDREEEVEAIASKKKDPKRVFFLAFAP